MQFIQNGLKSFRVTIESAYNDKIKFASGVELFIDVLQEQAEKVTLKGIVEYAPPNNTQNIKKGDTIFMRYDVVGDNELFSWGERQFFNLMMVDGKPQWFCSPEQLIAVERDGKMKVVPGLAIGKKVIENVKNTFGSLIQIPDEYAMKENPFAVEITDINENAMGVAVGDVVISDPTIMWHYNFSGIYGDDVIVIKEDNAISKISI